jgi:Na+-driven multidrug efflux pump
MPALGIRGIALGAAVGGACGVGVALWALFAGRCRIHLRARHLVPDWALLRRMLGLAWPPALHMVARTLIVVFFMALAGQLGGKVQAAYTIGLRLEMLVIMIAFPIANSCATLVGQNLGSGDRRRAWQAVWVSGAVELAALWPCALALFVFRREVVAFFTSDPEVAAMAVQYVSFSCGILLFYGLYFVAFRTLQAAGDMRSPMLISVGSAVLIGAPLGWLLATRTELGATGMWIANFVHASVNASLMIGWLLTGRWARRAASLE